MGGRAMREMIQMVLLICRLDPFCGFALAAALLAVPVIVIGAMGAFFPIEADEFEEDAA